MQPPVTAINRATRWNFLTRSSPPPVHGGRPEIAGGAILARGKGAEFAAGDTGVSANGQGLQGRAYLDGWHATSCSALDCGAHVRLRQRQRWTEFFQDGTGFLCC